MFRVYEKVYEVGHDMTNASMLNITRYYNNLQFSSLRSDHLSKHIKTHTKNRSMVAPDGSIINSTKLEMDDEQKIKTETEHSDAEGICSDDEDGEMVEGEEGDGDMDGEGEGEEGDGEDGEGENNEEMMITINAENENTELIISDSIESQA